MEIKKRFSRRQLLTIGISSLAAAGFGGLLYHFGIHSRSRKKIGSVLSVPGGDDHSYYRFAITPDSQKFLCFERRFYRQNIYLADFPPENSDSYQKILTLPNYNYWSSNPAFCGADASKFAMTGCYFRSPDVPEFPEFQNDEEFESWREAHPEYDTSTVNGVTDIDYSLAGFYIVIFDLGEKKSDFLVRIPEEIVGEPSKMAASLCWPLPDVMFLSVRTSVYQISLRDPEPKFEKILTLPEEIENSSSGIIRGLYYDTGKNILSAAVICRESADNPVNGDPVKQTFRMADVKFDVQGKSLVSADLIPEPIQPRTVISSDNSVIAAVTWGQSLIRTFIRGKENICVMTLKEDGALVAHDSVHFSEILWLEAVSPDGSIIIYKGFREYRYLRIG